MGNRSFFRVLAVTVLTVLAITFAATTSGVFADGDGDKNRDTGQDHDQVLTIPEKTELRNPNLGSHLNLLIEKVETGGYSAQAAAADSPIHSGGSVVVVTIYLSSNVEDVVSFLEDYGGDPCNVGEDYIESYVPVPMLGPVSERPGVIRVREIDPDSAG